MAQHKFKVGQDVDYTPGKNVVAASRYRVVRRLPIEHGELTYRIKSPIELFERVVRESEIAATTPDKSGLRVGSGRT